MLIYQLITARGLYFSLQNCVSQADAMRRYPISAAWSRFPSGKFDPKPTMRVLAMPAMITCPISESLLVVIHAQTKRSGASLARLAAVAMSAVVTTSIALGPLP